MMSPRWISEISVLVPISMTRVVVPPRQCSSRGEQRGDVVAADEAADVRRQVHIGAGADRQIELARLDVHGVAHGGDERRAAELPHRQPEQQVMHGGVAADRHIDDVGGGGADGQAQVMGECVDRRAGGLAQFRGVRRPLDGVIHAADDVGAPGHLRVLDAEAGDARAALQVDQEAGDIGGAEVDGKAERAAARRRKPDQFALADMRAQRPVAAAQRSGQLPGRDQIDRGQRARQRADHAVEIRQIVGQRRFRHADVAAHHGRIERQDFNGCRRRRIRPAPPAPASARRSPRCSRISASPGRPAPSAAFSAAFRARQRFLVGLVDLALDDEHAAGAAGAAAAAGADDANAAAAGGLKNRLAGVARDLAIELGKAERERRRRRNRFAVSHDAPLKAWPGPRRGRTSGTSAPKGNRRSATSGPGADRCRCPAPSTST